MAMVFNDAEFEAAEMAAWSDMARRILKGAAPDSLDRTDEDGLVTKLFYPANADDQAAADHLLPAFPHQRLAGGWQVCQPLAENATNTGIVLRGLFWGRERLWNGRPVKNCRAFLRYAKMSLFFVTAF